MNGNIWAVKSYLEGDKQASIIQYYKRYGNAERRAKRNILFGTCTVKTEIYLTNAVYSLDDDIRVASFIKDTDKHYIWETYDNVDGVFYGRS